MSKQKEVAAVAAQQDTANLPALLSQFEEDAGQGFENTTADAYAIPFVRILQGLSPQVKRSEGAYIPGAEEGMLYNTVTGQIFDGAEGIEVVPCHYRHTITHWKRREDGGGFLGEMSVNDPRVAQTKRDDKNRDILPDNTQLVDTRVHYVLLIKDGHVVSWAVITFASTQTKKSKVWMGKMDAIKMPRANGQGVFTPPMFSHSYRLRTVPEKNAKGSYMGWAIDLIGRVENPEIVAAAKKFREAINAGTHKEDFTAGAEGEEAAPVSGGTTDGVDY